MFLPSAAAAAGATRVELQGATLSDIDNPSSVGLRLQNGGNEQTFGAFGEAYATIGAWLKINGDYDCRYNAAGDTAEIGPSAANTWLSMAFSREFELVAGGGSSFSTTGTIELRDAITLVVLATATLNLTADSS